MRYSDREVPADLFDLNDFVNDDDAADNADLTFSVNDAPPHVVYNQNNDMVLLTYLPPGSKDTPAVDVITVGVSDGFNGADGLTI